MENFTRIIRDYPDVNFRFTKGRIDIFNEKQLHQDYEIYFLLGGSVEFINDHIRRKISPYSLVIIQPGEYHRFVVEDERFDVYERCVLNINPSFFADDILRQALEGKEYLQLSSNHRIAENIMYLKDSMLKVDKDDFKYILSAIATDIVFLIKQSYEESTGISYDSLNPTALKIMDYVNKNCRSNITVNDIAKEFFLSPSSVSHIFKNNFDISIKKYITEKRLHEIYTLLQNGRKPQEISNDFGFKNYSTFYRSFLNRFGVSPSHVAKTNNAR